MKNVLIVEDDEVVRDWLGKRVKVIFPNAQLQLAACLEESLAMVKKQCFCLALIDLGLPDGSGLRLLQELQKSAPATTTVVLTVLNEDDSLLAAFSAGADGYLLKEDGPKEIEERLRKIVQGEPILSSVVAKRLIDHFRLTAPARAEYRGITAREKEILALIGRGRRNSEVAKQLQVSDNTVATHIKSIYQKLGISSRAEASWHATKFGL